MSKVTLHPLTGEAVRQFLDNPGHALCLIGPAGAGKKFLARHLAEQILGDKQADSILTVSAEASISIEQIRSLQKFLSLKKPGRDAVKRVVLVLDAQTMGDEAQNALLKTLEEPPDDTIIILTVDSMSSLKPTIYSRAQHINILPLKLDQLESLFGSSAKLKQAYHLSGGYAAIFHGLIQNSQHNLIDQVERAKHLMNINYYDRLLLVEDISKAKDQALLLVYALERVVGAAIAAQKNGQQIKRLVHARRAIHEAKIDMKKNANLKLVMTDLLLAI